MFAFALFAGLLSFTYFFIGLTGLLHKQIVIILALLYGIVFLYIQRKKIQSALSSKKLSIRKLIKLLKQNKLFTVLMTLLLSQGIVNFMGALSPELAFDALWYHLTMPKLYLQSHMLYYIPGGLLHYSAMPQLGEMLYAGALALGDEITVKVLHFLFGLLTAGALYILVRKYFTPLIAIIAVVIFYSNIVVAWESTTAYIDLIRTFYEFMALWAFLLWFELRKRKWLIISAIMVGFAICTKLLALGSVGIFVILILYVAYEKRKFNISVIRDVSLFVITALVVALPWFIYAFVNTGNPVYPLFSNSIELSYETGSIISFFPEIWKGFMQSSDPISPIYMIFLPLIIVFYPKFSKESKVVALYSLLAIIIWYFTPRMGGGRFLLPYLPAFSILCAAALSHILKKVRMSVNFLFIFLLLLIMFTSVVTIGYRFVAQLKYLPVLFGQQTKHEFLTNNLNFAFGDFYDTDFYFKKNIKPEDVVLLYGFHNLYYVEFPFIHAAWVRPGDKFNYIAVQNGEPPERFANWQLFYSNAKTKVKLFRPSKGDGRNTLCVY